MALVVTRAGNELNEPPACQAASRKRGRAPCPGLSPEGPAMGRAPALLPSCPECLLMGISAVPPTRSVARSHPR